MSRVIAEPPRRAGHLPRDMCVTLVTRRYVETIRSRPQFGGDKGQADLTPQENPRWHGWGAVKCCLMSCATRLSITAAGVLCNPPPANRTICF